MVRKNVADMIKYNDVLNMEAYYEARGKSYRHAFGRGDAAI